MDNSAGGFRLSTVPGGCYFTLAHGTDLRTYFKDNAGHTQIRPDADGFEQLGDADCSTVYRVAFNNALLTVPGQPGAILARDRVRAPSEQGAVLPLVGPRLYLSNARLVLVPTLAMYQALLDASPNAELALRCLRDSLQLPSPLALLVNPAYRSAVAFHDRQVAAKNSEARRALDAAQAIVDFRQAHPRRSRWYDRSGWAWIARPLIRRVLELERSIALQLDLRDSLDRCNTLVGEAERHALAALEPAYRVGGFTDTANRLLRFANPARRQYHSPVKTALR